MCTGEQLWASVDWAKGEGKGERRFPLQPVRMNKVSIENLEHKSRRRDLILFAVPLVLYKKFSKMSSTSFSSKKITVKKQHFMHIGGKQKYWSENKRKNRERNVITILLPQGRRVCFAASRDGKDLNAEWVPVRPCTWVSSSMSVLLGLCLSKRRRVGRTCVTLLICKMYIHYLYI